MTDEGQVGEPMDAVEMMHAIQGASEAVRAMFESFVASGFTEAQALHLAATYLHGLAGGKLA